MTAGVTATSRQLRVLPPLGDAESPHGLPGRAGALLARRRRDLAWLTPLVLVAAVVQLVNLTGSPQRIDDEGTYAAQAWAIGALGELTHYTYWYDHPPLGWIQIALWTGGTGAFGRHAVAVMAAREAMVVAALISVVLLWLLARRLGVSRAGATVAGVLFAVSPLALQFHRQVFLDNVATPWLLLALLLAGARRRQLLAFGGAALAFGVAVLSKETYLLALPLVAWVMWRSAAVQTRRYTLTVAASVLVLVGGSYLVLALVKGELVPGIGRVSLLDGVTFQLAGREASGSVLDPGSLSRRTASMWWQLDPVLLLTGPLAALAGLAVRRLRPYAIALLCLAAVGLRPGGYLPVPYVIMLLPLAALLVAGVTDAAVRGLRARGPRPAARAGWLVVVAAALIAAVPLWGVQLRGFLRADLDAPMRQAQEWLEQNVQRDATLVVDDAMWVDLVRAGFGRESVLWYYKVDTDPAVEALLPGGWRDVDYVVTTDSMRTFPTAFPQVSETIANSVVVASYGTGTTQVDIRRVDPQGLEHAEAAEAAAASARGALGGELAGNPALDLRGQTADLLRAGLVDGRIMLALASLPTPVSVVDVPVMPGEGDEVRRRVLLRPEGSDAQDPAAWRALADWLETLSGPVAARAVSVTADGVLATWSVDEPAGLLPTTD